MSKQPASKTTLDSLSRELQAVTKIFEDFETRKAKILADDRLSPQAKAADQKALLAEVSQRIKESRDAIMKKIQAELAVLDEVEEGFSRAARISPKTAEHWAMANSRALFVREDMTALADSDPGQIVKEFRYAIQEQDKVLAFLIARYGPDALAKTKRDEGAALSALRALEAAIREAESVDPAKLQSIAESRNLLQQLRYDGMAIIDPDVRLRAAEQARANF